MGQPAPVPGRASGSGEPVLPVELAVVHHRLAYAARFRYRAEVSVHMQKKEIRTLNS